jgi:hypothetical protein
MIEKTDKPSETKTCEACGRDFSCGARAEKCWCFEVDLSAETTTKLRKIFLNCLCRECLERENKLRIKAN